MEQLQFNPFSLVAQQGKDIIINATPELSTRFEGRHRDIVDYFVQKKTFSEREALALIAPTRLQEMLSKRIFLKEPLEDINGRYSRQLGFFSITSDDPEGRHEQLRQAHVLVLGAGAIGSHVSWNMAAIGVGKITIVDFDRVEESNLNRQYMYAPSDIGQLKVHVLGEKIKAFNPTVEVVSIDRKISSDADVLELASGVSLIVKAIDTPEESMSWVNAVCVEKGISFVSGGFIDHMGVVGPNYIPGKSTCFACHGSTGDVRRLYGMGPTFGPLTSLVSSMLAMMAFKILVKEDDALADKMFTYNTDSGEWQSQDVSPETNSCQVCGREAAEAGSHEAPKESKPGLWPLRASMMAMMMLTLVLNQFFDQSLVGTMTFFLMFLIIPVVKALTEGSHTKARREFFILSCIYIGFSLLSITLAALIDGGGVTWPSSLREAMDGLRLASAMLLQSVMAITFIFFSICGVSEFGPKVVKFLNQEL